MKWGAHIVRKVKGRKKVIHVDSNKWIFGPVGASEGWQTVKIGSIGIKENGQWILFNLDYNCFGTLNINFYLK